MSERRTVRSSLAGFRRSQLLSYFACAETADHLSIPNSRLAPLIANLQQLSADRDRDLARVIRADREADGAEEGVLRFGRKACLVDVLFEDGVNLSTSRSIDSTFVMVLRMIPTQELFRRPTFEFTRVRKRAKPAVARRVQRRVGRQCVIKTKHRRTTTIAGYLIRFQTREILYFVLPSVPNIGAVSMVRSSLASRT